MGGTRTMEWSSFPEEERRVTWATMEETSPSERRFVSISPFSLTAASWAIMQGSTGRLLGFSPPKPQQRAVSGCCRMRRQYFVYGDKSA